MRKSNLIEFSFSQTNRYKIKHLVEVLLDQFGVRKADFLEYPVNNVFNPNSFELHFVISVSSITISDTECLEMASKLEYKESEKKTTIKLKLNGRVDTPVLIYGELDLEGNCKVNIFSSIMSSSNTFYQ